MSDAAATGCGLIFTFPTPLGPMTASVLEGVVVSLCFSPGAAETAGEELGIDEKRLRGEICDYFAGTRREFTMRTLSHGTPFQRAVLREIARIPFGSAHTYQEVAERAGFPGAARAVGSSAANNPVLLLIPCHRVVRSGGAISGYAGGMERKMLLLAHERAVTGRATRPLFSKPERWRQKA